MRIYGNFPRLESVLTQPGSKLVWESAEVTLAPEGLIAEILWKGKTDPQAIWYLPGLCDVHCHIGVGLGGQQVDTEQAQKQLETNWKNGVLAIRDAGANYCADPQAILHCGAHISRPKRYLRHLGVTVKDPRYLAEEVLTQYQISGKWVKLVADWIDRDRGELAPLWTLSQLEEAFQILHEAGGKVTAHAFSAQAIPDLLLAGIDCIEHGTGITYEQAKYCAHNDIAVTPTLLQRELFRDFAAPAQGKYPRYYQTMLSLYEARQEQFLDLVAAGVQLLPGSDAGGYQEHGCLPRELKLWVDYGLEPEAVVRYATFNCREYFGFNTLAVGEKVEIVGYRENPTRDINQLFNPQVVYRHGSLPILDNS